MKKFIIIGFFVFAPLVVVVAEEPMLVRAGERYCIQVIASARNRATGEVRTFPTPCDIPEGWDPLPFGEQPTPLTKPSPVTTLPEKFLHVRGRILLQVQRNGESWYVNPNTGLRYFLGRPADAFMVMRKQGLGVSNTDFAQLFGRVPAGDQKLYVKDTTFGKRLAGYILLQVERNGEAYYLDPTNQTAYYLGRPAAAFDIMRNRGLGITEADIAQVPAAQ